MRLRFCAVSDKGDYREENQDRWLASDLRRTLLPRGGETLETSAGSRGILLAVADGMGGAAGGAEAAELSLKVLARSFARDAAGKDPLGGLVRGMEAAHAAVQARGRAQSALRGMGTTLTAAHLRGRTLRLAHVGDCRAYLVRRGEMAVLTTDHNVLVKLGGMDPDEARARRLGNMLVQCVGGQTQALAVETGRIEARRGDRLLLCSDGLHGAVPREKLRRLLTVPDPALAARELLEAALGGAATDNVTALVADVVDESLPSAKWDEGAFFERLTEVVYDPLVGGIVARPTRGMGP